MLPLVRVRSRALFRPVRGLTLTTFLVIAVVQLTVVLFGSYRLSPTLNEPSHIVGGLAILDRADFSIARINPPIPRLIAAIGALIVSPQRVSEIKVQEYEGVRRSEVPLGDLFIAANCDQIHKIVFAARSAVCCVFLPIGWLVVVLWTRQLWGNSAVVPVFALWAFEPMMVAHAGLATADFAASVLGMLAVYSFVRWILKRTWSTAIVAGVCLGIAELSKFTWLILYPTFFVALIALIVIRQITKKLSPGTIQSSSTISGESSSLPGENVSFKDRFCAKLLLQFASIVLVSLVVVNNGYLWSGSFLPLSDYQFRSDLLREVAPGTEEWLKESPFAALPVPLPRDYILGIDDQSYDFEYQKNLNYLCGEFSKNGWISYYLWGLATKSTHGLQLSLLLTLAFLPWLFTVPRGNRDTIWLSRVAAITMIVATAGAVLLAASVKMEINQHVRYVHFVFFAASLIGGGVFAKSTSVPDVMNGLRRGLSWLVIALAVVPGLLSVPRSLSYFNRLSGGTAHGHEYLIHSNLDWGQGLGFLVAWDREHQTDLPKYAALYGVTPPACYGLDDYRAMAPQVEKAGQQGWYRIRFPAGRYAISTNTLAGFPSRLQSSGGSFRLPPTLITRFAELPAVTTLDGSISIFELLSPLTFEVPASALDP